MTIHKGGYQDGKKEDRSEFVGSVIDIFEGFLDEKGHRDS